MKEGAFQTGIGSTKGLCWRKKEGLKSKYGLATENEAEGGEK